MASCSRILLVPRRQISLHCEHCGGWPLYDRVDDEWRCLQCGRLAAVKSETPWNETAEPAA